MNKVYEIVTNKIIKMLEEGEIPWRKPWKVRKPKNLITGREYRGINRLLLMNTEFNSPCWLTPKQVKEINGKVKKGQKPTFVVFWKLYDKEVINEEGERIIVTIPVLRFYHVFNAEQCELPRKWQEKAELEENQVEVNQDEKIRKCYEIVKNMPNPPAIVNQGARAYYDPINDRVVVPIPSLFKSIEFYYATLFHELVHSTGHESRLNRIKKVEHFGSEEYSREELVAELGAAFLCAETGISQPTIKDSAAYIQGWLKKLRNDKRLVIQAAAQAEKAVAYILGEKNSR